MRGPVPARRLVLTSYLIVFGACAATAFVGTPLVRRLSVRVGAVAHPSDRMVHKQPTPSMGGLAMYGAVLVGLWVARLLPFFDDLGRGRTQWYAVLVATSVIVLVGAVDDLRGLSAPAKLAGQILAAGLLVLGGVLLQFFFFPGQGILVLGADVAVPVTILWVVLMVNAINLIDGLDGLAAGMVAIAAVAFFAYMVRSPEAFGDASAAALLAAITAGVALGFLPWNFNPARIFMGDSGAMLLGMLLAVSTIFGVGRNPYPPSGGDVAVLSLPVFLPLLVLAIPFLDVALAIARRVRRGRGLAHADKEHIHHRLLDIGHSHRKAVLLMYLWSGLISICALAVAFIDSRVVVGAKGPKQAPQPALRGDLRVQPHGGVAHQEVRISERALRDGEQLVGVEHPADGRHRRRAHLGARVTRDEVEERAATGVAPERAKPADQPNPVTRFQRAPHPVRQRRFGLLDAVGAERTQLDPWRGGELPAEQPVPGTVTETFAEVRPHSGLVAHLDDAGHDAPLLECTDGQRRGPADGRRLGAVADREQRRLAAHHAEEPRRDRGVLADPGRWVVLQQAKHAATLVLDP